MRRHPERIRTTPGWFDPKARPPMAPYRDVFGDKSFVIVDATPTFCRRHVGGTVKMSEVCTIDHENADPETCYVEWSAMIIWTTKRVCLVRLRPMENGIEYCVAINHVGQELFTILEEIGGVRDPVSMEYWTLRDTHLVQLALMWDKVE